MKKSRIKVLSIGDTETGKSCLIKRYCERRFITKYFPTIGVDFGVTKVSTNGHELKVNLFDLSGHEAFKEVRNEFYKDTQAVMLVYDVNRPYTLHALDSWLNEIKTYIGNPKQIETLVFVVFANKTDQLRNQLDFDQGKLWADKNGCLYCETSANTGDGVSEAFEKMFEGVVEVLQTGTKSKSTPVMQDYTKEQADLVQRLLNSKSHYTSLDLTLGCSKDEVIKSYRRLARLIHPDKCFVPRTEEAFKILTAAREELSKIAKK